MILAGVGGQQFEELMLSTTAISSARALKWRRSAVPHRWQLNTSYSATKKDHHRCFLGVTNFNSIDVGDFNPNAEINRSDRGTGTSRLLPLPASARISQLRAAQRRVLPGRCNSRATPIPRSC